MKSLALKYLPKSPALIARWLVVAGTALWSSAASAALDWCQVSTLFPSSTTSFEASATAIDQFGCKTIASESAHLRMWKCTDAKLDDTVIYLEREVTGYPRRIVLTVESDRKDLGHLRTCPGIEAPPKSY